MFKKVLIDCHAEIDLPRNRLSRTIEDIAKDFENEAKELESFIRDHRSRDRYGIEIVRVYEERCEYCGSNKESAIAFDGSPACCVKAVEEYEKSLVK